MEAIGLGVGVAGLAGLFSTCVDCLQLIQQGRYLGEAYLLLETKFANQKLRFVSWGQACGLADPEGHDERLNERELRLRVEDTLVQLMRLFKDEKQLRKKYGLRQGQALIASPSGPFTAGSLVNWTASGTSALSQKLQDLKRRVEKTQKQAGIRSAAKWAIADKQKFTELIRHVKDLVDDLEGLTRYLGIDERQRDIIQCEVESMTDIHSLETIEAARWGTIDPISDAASLHLWRLRDHRQYSMLDEQQSAMETTIRNCTDVEEAAWDTLPDFRENLPSQVGQTDYQILHRVHCPEHGSPIFLKEPAGRWHDDKDEWAFLDPNYPTREQDGRHLRDSRRLPDLSAYLKQNCSLQFVVFHEHQCDCTMDDSTDDSTDDMASVLVDQSMVWNSQMPAQSIRLISNELCIGLNQMAESEAIPLDFTPGSELSAPYVWFYWARTKLLRKPNAESDELDYRIKHLLDYISTSMSQEYAKIDRLIASDSISWKYLPYLFVPGTILVDKVISRGISHYRAYKQLMWPTFTKSRAPGLQIKVCSYVQGIDSIDFHLQESVLFVDCMHTFDPFPIRKLPYFPLKYENEAERYLRRNGELLWQHRDGACVSYTGFSVHFALFKDKRFIVDCWTSRRTNGGGGENSKKTLGDLPCEPFIFLLPSKFYGRDLDTHARVELWASCARPVLWKDNPFEDLILDWTIKELLHALFKRQMLSKQASETAIATQSNQGAVLLFQGPPGVGKSSVAGAAAEMAKRPLYLLDLTRMPHGVSEIQKHFWGAYDFGLTWDFIILLEGVGPILTYESDQSLEKYALVASLAAFLGLYKERSITVIMTADDNTPIHQKIRSQISLVVDFPALSETQRSEIWKMVLRKSDINEECLSRELSYPLLAGSGTSGNQVPKELLSTLSQSPLDGRQIHDLVLIAQQSSSQEGSKPSHAILIDLLLAHSESVERGQGSW